MGRSLISCRAYALCFAPPLLQGPCYEAVIGRFQESTGAYTSIQKCATDADCFSEECDIPEPTSG